MYGPPGFLIMEVVEQEAMCIEFHVSRKFTFFHSQGLLICYNDLK